MTLGKVKEFGLSQGIQTQSGRNELNSKRTRKSSKTEQSLIMNVARAIGSTFETLAAKTGAVTKHPTRLSLAKWTKSSAAKTRHHQYVKS
jgi:hypothetical protein